MTKFSIIDTGGRKQDIQYLVRELRQKGMIYATEKDVNLETIYLTNNIAGIKRVMEDYDGLILDIHRS